MYILPKNLIFNVVSIYCQLLMLTNDRFSSLLLRLIKYYIFSLGCTHYLPHDYSYDATIKK